MQGKLKSALLVYNQNSQVRRMLLTEADLSIDS